MVKRSLEAANAIMAGNSRSRIASVSMSLPLQRGAMLDARSLRFRYRRHRSNPVTRPMRSGARRDSRRPAQNEKAPDCAGAFRIDWQNAA